MSKSYSIVALAALSGLAVGQDCPDGIGFVSGIVYSTGSGSKVFDSPDNYSVHYDTSFYARIETDNGEGEIEGAAFIDGSRSGYTLQGYGGSFENLSADVIISIPADTGFEIFDSSNVFVSFSPGGQNPGQIDGGSSGTLSAGTYRLQAATDYGSNADIDWELSLTTQFDLITPPCDADLAAPCGVLDFSDALAFLTAFGKAEAAADLAEPFGVWDYSDVFAYLVAFGAGCP